MIPFPQSEPLPTMKRLTSHVPHPLGGLPEKPVDPAVCEALLTEWFGRPVVLLASGRTGLSLFLRFHGFTRYGHKLQMPHFLSRCILNAVTNHAFPVEPPHPADGVLFYHQYGFPQRTSAVGGIVIEDIAHAFFCQCLHR